MNAPAPLLRPALPGARPGGGRPPRLGLAIPPSPNVKPVGNSAAGPGGRPALPVLHLATPMGSTVVPQEHAQGRAPVQGQSASGGSESSAAHSRSGSFGPLDGRASNPTSAGSQYSALSFASQYGIGRPQGTPDPVSAVGSLYSNASESGGPGGDDGPHGLENFDKLSLEKARTLDVEDLDSEGWRIASMEKRIQELGSLGEGAGGAVTRCKLKGGSTVFALKVGRSLFSASSGPAVKCGCLLTRDSRLSRPTRIQMSRSRLCVSLASIRSVRQNTSVGTMAPLWIRQLPPFPSPWSSARAGRSTASTRR